MRLLPATANRYLYLFMAMTALACLFIPFDTTAQNSNSIVPDSLIQLLHENRDDDENRAEAFAKVIDFLFDARCYEQAKPYIDGLENSDFVNQDAYYTALCDYYKGAALLFEDPKESFRLLKKAEQKYLMMKKTRRTEILGMRIYSALGSHYYENSKMLPESFECTQKALDINATLKDDKSAFIIESNVGLGYIMSDRYEDAIAVYKGILTNPKYTSFRKYVSNFNIGYAYKNMHELDSAKMYFENAYHIAASRQDSLRALGEIVVLPFLNKEYERAMFEIEAHLDEIVHEGDVKTSGSVLFVLGKTYHRVGRLEDAVTTLEYCLDLCGSETTYDWIKQMTLEELKVIATEQKEYNKFWKTQTLLDSVNDRLQKEEQVGKLMQLQLRHEYEEIEVQMKYERDMERIRETRKSVITYFIIAVLLLAIILSLIMLSRKNIVLKAKQAEKERLSDELEGKKQELVSKLLSQTKANDTLNEVKEQLASMEGMKEEDRADILVKTVRKINEVINANSDDNLDFYFLQVHPKFYDNLRRDFPDLTLGELRLCALIKLNMNTKDIASINNITVNGVKVARWRLRKKLGMNDANDNLSDFLANY